MKTTQPRQYPYVAYVTTTNLLTGYREAWRFTVSNRNYAEILGDLYEIEFETGDCAPLPPMRFDIIAITENHGEDDELFSVANLPSPDAVPIATLTVY